MKTLLLLLAYALVAVGHAEAQVFVNGQPMVDAQETKTVSSTTVGVTANLCGPGNAAGVVGQVLSAAGIYAAVHNTAATADSGDFTFAQYDVFFVKPASLLRMIRITTDATVKLQCVK